MRHHHTWKREQKEKEENKEERSIHMLSQWVEKEDDGIHIRFNLYALYYKTRSQRGRDGKETERVC